jgi:ectoine hydroxylase-related dioxygenase (phytanoyl-CoA dioxygenase family)
MERRFEEFSAFVRESRAAEIAARLMRSRTAVFYHDHLLVKEPRTQERTLWHHDQPYWPVDGEQIVSLWIPLDPVPRDVCPEWVRGSHRWGAWYAPRYFKDGEDLGDAPPAGYDAVPDVDARRGELELLSWDVEPGDCVAFHARTLHGAPGNPSSTRRRRAYALRWVGDDARWAERPGRTSPPIDDHGLRPGDPLAGARFPVLWPRDARDPA